MYVLIITNMYLPRLARVKILVSYKRVRVHASSGIIWWIRGQVVEIDPHYFPLLFKLKSLTGNESDVTRPMLHDTLTTQIHSQQYHPIAASHVITSIFILLSIAPSCLTYMIRLTLIFDFCLLPPSNSLPTSPRHPRRRENSRP